MPKGLSSQRHGDSILLPAALQQEAGFKGKSLRESGREYRTQTSAGPGRQRAGVKPASVQTPEEGPLPLHGTLGRSLGSHASL